MRIIAGAFRGHRLARPPDARVRPTADKVREAWFSILGPRIVGARILDLFAGSGALGLEALSRGAAHATFVELRAPSLRALRANIEALGVTSRTTVHRGDAVRFIDRLEAGSFDVAFADPPYATAQAEAVRARFVAHPFARVLGIEHGSTLDLRGEDTRRYGNVALTFFYAP